MREHFLLEPDVAFLNHGSFGACPKPVFEAYQHWQLTLERQPVRFFQRMLDTKLDEVRATVSEYLHIPTETLHFVRNATVGMNYIARSIPLNAGDEVLTTNHEYGAMDAMWTFICQQQNAHYLKQSIPLPYTTDEAFIAALWKGVTPRTKVIFLSHITSPTALKFPVAEVARRARTEGIITVVDGAHAPGQIPLDLTTLDVDYYTGNFHKWLCAPKSSGFLYARAEHQASLYPLIVSWGWINEQSPVMRLQWKGTDDHAAYLALPDALTFQQQHNWDAVRVECHTLAVDARAQLMALLGTDAPAPADNFVQLFIVALPPCDAKTVQDRLYFEHRVEVPIIQWQARQFVRVSVQGYNTPQDLERLHSGLADIFDITTSNSPT